MTLQELIIEILEKGIYISDVYLKEVGNTKTFSYRIKGFYKSDGVDLYETEEGIFAESRYNQIEQITCFKDLVSLNYEWWCRSKDRYEGWAVPDSKWIKHLIEEGLVKEETHTVKTYK